MRAKQKEPVGLTLSVTIHTAPRTPAWSAPSGSASLRLCLLSHPENRQPALPLMSCLPQPAKKWRRGDGGKNKRRLARWRGAERQR